MKITVEAYEKGLKFRNGRLVEILGPGRYRVATIWAKERIATKMPKLPPANLMADTPDSYHPNCPRSGERRVLADAYRGQA